jgi:release factor glutamine methyltransferase
VTNIAPASGSWPRRPTVREAGVLGRTTLADAGLSEPRLEAAILLGHVLHLDPSGLLIHAAEPIDRVDITAYQALVERRLRREPTAYITGTKQWLDMDVSVNRNVLIPRPETETLVESAIADAITIYSRLGHAPTIVDVGTGSGAIACAIARACPTARVQATDTEAGALRTARQNSEHLAGGRIEFVQCDLLPEEVTADLIVANLPYIPTAELVGLEPELAYEPRSALDGGAEGMDAINRLLERLEGGLRPGGVAWFECHYDQAARIVAHAQALLRDCRTSILADLAGIDRFVRIVVR